MRNKLTPYLFVSPAMLLLVAFGIFPILVAAVISTTNMNISAFANWGNVKFIGVDNYTKLFADPDFWQSIGNTGLFAVFGVPAIVVLSLGVALLLNHSQNAFFRALRAFYFIPAINLGGLPPFSGFIGKFASLLGDAKINIATFHVGREAPGGNAVALIEIDGELPEDVLARVRALPQVQQAKPLKF